jgi:putative addiction module component (TIGR02574 family)
MPITPDQIVDEASRWPLEKLAELVDRLTLILHHSVSPAVDESWNREVRRRLAEIESGQVQAVPGEEVSAKVRRIVER